MKLLNNFVGKFDDDILKDKKHIHMIGIGGSGMYPLAQILHSKGYYITGSDNNETDTLKAVRSMGIEVFLGQSADNIKGADLIIRTAPAEFLFWSEASCWASSQRCTPMPYASAEPTARPPLPL